MVRNWIGRLVGYVTYDWLITTIIIVGVALVLAVAFGGGDSGPVMVTTLIIGVIMGIMVAARQKSITDRENQRPKKKRR